MWTCSEVHAILYMGFCGSNLGQMYLYSSVVISTDILSFIPVSLILILELRSLVKEKALISS